MAKELGRHHGTISQESYAQRRKASVPLGKWNPELASSIEEKLQATWSSEQIIERLRQEGQAMVCLKRSIAGSMQACWQKGSSPCSGIKASGRSQWKSGASLPWARRFLSAPKSSFSLFQVVGKSKGCVATFVEHKTRLYTAIRMPDRTALSMEIAFVGLWPHSTLPMHFKPLALTVARSLPVTPAWKKIVAYRCIS